MCRGYVEQVVGHPRQCLYLSLDDREHLASLDRARRGGIPEHVKRASDRGERVAQLVRKRRQETVLWVLLCSQPCGGRGEVIVGVAQRPVESIQLTGPVEQFRFHLLLAAPRLRRPPELVFARTSCLDELGDVLDAVNDHRRRRCLRLIQPRR